MIAEIKIEGFEPLIIDSKTERANYIRTAEEKGEAAKPGNIIKYYVFDSVSKLYIETEKNPRKFMSSRQRLLKVIISRSGLVKTILDPELT